MAIGGYSKRGTPGTKGNYATRLEYEQAVLAERDRLIAAKVPASEIVRRVASKCGSGMSAARTVIRRYTVGGR